MVNIDYKFFFDRQYVADRIDDGTRKSLSKLGAFVRTDARGSIRSRKKPASPGSPPSSHTGLLKQFIFFAYDPETKSVVIGPQVLGNSKRRGSLTVPQLLEQGGNTLHWKTGKPTTYKAFPFMKPAFDRNIGKFPEFFSNML